MSKAVRPASSAHPIVVLTGASSGIGRATAQALALRGARLVLAARASAALDVVCQECEERGAEAVACPTDVTDADSMRSLGARSVERFGDIDVWINNVGVGAMGAFERTPIEAHRRVIESNLLGHVHGSHVALTHFRRRGRGILINMISLGGWLASPYAAAYTASKFGLRGLGQSLRAELANERDIHVCDVYPAFVDTPGMTQHGANYTGHRLRPLPPLLVPEVVAARIVGLLDRPRPTLPVGAVAHFARYTYPFAPELRGRSLKRFMDWAIARAPRAQDHDGNLFERSGTHTVAGAQRRRPRAAAMASMGILGVAGVALYALVRR